MILAKKAVFEAGYPLEAPDLCTYLILQMDFLTYAAHRLKKHQEATYWQEKSASLLQIMISKLWVNNRFVARNSFTGVYDSKSNSFLNYILT